MARSGMQLPPSASGSGLQLSRRDLLRVLGVAGAGVAVASCGSDSGGGGGSSTASKEVTVGSNASDAVPKKAYEEVFAGFNKATGLTAKVNTVDHNTFQEQINSYLQGRPDDMFMWFAGYRMQFFAERGLATPVSDVWEKVGANYTDALKAASTGVDGKQYFIPFYYYPWAFFYRKSVFDKNGYQPAKTWDELVALSKQMQKDGLTPIAFADKDGWPAMGTFDYLNMRINGYDFHINLMGGKESWTDPKVTKVFDTWRELLPYHQTGSLGRTWQDAAKTLADKKAGLYLLGMFVGQQFQGAAAEDLDFFAFPEIDSTIGTDSVEAPIDGFMLSKKLKNEEGAKKLLEYLAGAEAVNTYLKSDPNNIAANTKADTSGYSALQKKAVDLIGSAKHISQFLDRDTRPDFASTVMIPSLQTFIRNPNDVAGLTKKIEDQKKSIFAG
jgi:multiple sugar transport system substrate-binding protein